MRPRAIVLLSGGLDSTTCLAWAQSQYECIALSFMYGQRSTTELDAARALTAKAGVEHLVLLAFINHVHVSLLVGFVAMPLDSRCPRLKPSAISIFLRLA